MKTKISKIKFIIIDDAIQTKSITKKAQIQAAKWVKKHGIKGCRIVHASEVLLFRPTQ